MTDAAQPVMLSVLAGDFDSQAAAYYALRAEAEKIGIEIDPTDTDVIREASEVRLAHYFRPAIVARIEAARGDDNTLVLLFPSQLTALTAFPPESSGLRLLGRFAGRLASRI